MEDNADEVDLEQEALWQEEEHEDEGEFSVEEDEEEDLADVDDLKEAYVGRSTQGPWITPAKEAAVRRAKEKGIGGAPTKGRRRASVPHANSMATGMEMPNAPMSRMERIHHASQAQVALR